MKTRTLIGALLAAGVIGGGVGAAIEPITHANAAQTTAAGVAAPAANPSATTLPLNGFSAIVKQHGPAVVNVSVDSTRRVARGEGDGDDAEPEIPGLEQIPPQFRDFFRGFRGRVPGMPRGGEGQLMR